MIGRRGLAWLLLTAGCLACHVATQTTESDTNVEDVLVFTVATNETDGFKRYLRSAEVYGFKENLRVLGLGKEWKGGYVKRWAGGGFKVNLFKEALEEYKNDEDRIILVTDSYDVIFLAGLPDIVDKFKTTGARILFSAEASCWPDRSLATKYPPVSRGKRFLNSGSFMGYASDIHAIVTRDSIGDEEDDQLFFTKAYLDDALREKHKIKLDHKSEIFQNLYAAVADVELRFKGQESYLQNTVYNTVPLVLHGNGLSKLVLNSLGNYLAHAWSPEKGCLACWEGTIELDASKEETYPVVVIAVFIERPTPFLEATLKAIYKQAYPKSRLHLFVHNNEPFHEKVVEKFFKKYSKEYRSSKQVIPSDGINEVEARNLAMDYCQLKECSALFSIDSVAHLDNEHTLKLLVEQQRDIVAPLLVRPYKAWSNFWGAITDDGFYARSFDYMEIVKNERRGLWNVPFVCNCYLVNATLIKNPKTRPTYSVGELDTEMAFAYGNRERSIFMYVSNRVDFGHLINPENYDVSLTNPDFYQIMDNKIDWEKRYIHEEYSESFNPEKKPIQPCPDVYWFPIASPHFTKELIDIVEGYGKWSDGSNHDPRLSGGYENVPTRDIHMNQVELESQWLFFLREYVRPLQELVFTGYYHDDPRIDGGYEAVPTRDIHMRQVGLHEAWLYFLKEYVSPLQDMVFIGYLDTPPRSLMNFVVRYKPEEQPSLKPHHDSSTYTINIALNKVGEDYVGGGCRFIRYNCSVTDTKPGWMLMHPGRLTHYHEGLRVTNGTRYIMISFIDP